MRRYHIILLLLISTGNIFGLSFPEYPLMTMIEKSEFIVHGVVISNHKTDCISKLALKTESREKRFCWSGNASETARIKILSVYKGKLNQDTISIPYQSDAYYDFPSFSENDTVVLYLNSFSTEGYFGKSDPRFGVKTSELDDYIKYTNTFLDFVEEPDSVQSELILNWLIDLACNKNLTWEGTKVLRNLNDTLFTDSTKSILTNSLLEREKLGSKDEYLVEIVAEFGFNKKVLDYCIIKLENLLSDDLYYLTSFYLMQVIYEMDRNRKYKKLIDDYFDTFYRKKDIKEMQLSIIQDFIIETKKH